MGATPHPTSGDDGAEDGEDDDAEDEGEDDEDDYFVENTTLVFLADTWRMTLSFLL